MSRSQKPETKDRILAAARALLEERGYHGVGLEDIAAEAGVSRQAVYLHFGSKAGLLLALVDYVDRVEDLERHLRRFADAPSALDALDAAVDLQAAYTPKILDTVKVFESARRTDPDARAAWDDRMAGRHAHAVALATRLKREGVLATGWTVETAADLIWGLSLPGTFEALVEARGWSPRTYAKHLKRLLRATLTTTRT